MPAHLPWSWLLILGIGCHAVTANGPSAREDRTAVRGQDQQAVPAVGTLTRQSAAQVELAQATGRGEVARRLWEEGQSAMRQGQPDRAITCYQQSLAADPRLTRNHLSLAAAYLEKGDQAAACPHLSEYVVAHPDSVLVRVRHAELLWQLGHRREARAAFEGTVADAQDDLEAAQLIHCHTRLMLIAEAEADEYDEHLHRGIGLYLLARERAAAPDPEGELPAEGLLCRAAAELTLAHRQRDSEARPCWYLYQVWSQLAQRQPAGRCLREATTQAPFSYLTPSEQRGLELARRDDETRARRR